MKTRTLIATAMGVLCAGLTFAQQPVAAPGEEAPVFGAQIMTEQERVEHRERMRAAGTPEEREQLRLEHHKQMVERARERGVTLPDEPPMRGGMGAGAGMGAGGGMGPGGGRGPGAGMGLGGGMGPGGRMGSGAGMGPGGGAAPGGDVPAR
ncbi:MAG TPA: hypothetical protein PLT98_08060 [Thauera aminoaromatica]|nr:hypothetical protein [Thauera aminoaromatica]